MIGLCVVYRGDIFDGKLVVIVFLLVKLGILNMGLSLWLLEDLVVLFVENWVVFEVILTYNLEKVFNFVSIDS